MASIPFRKTLFHPLFKLHQVNSFHVGSVLKAVEKARQRNEFTEEAAIVPFFEEDSDSSCIPSSNGFQPNSDGLHPRP